MIDLAVVGLPLAFLYAATVAHDLGTIDSGELATVCARLGIAHPTGYPLYTLLGRIAVVVHPGSPIEAVNALSAVAAWLSAIVTASVTRILTRAVAPSPSLWSRWIAPWTAALWFGIDRELWKQATGNEVYSLHLLAVAGLLGLLVAIGKGQAGPRVLLGLGYLAGLAFAHHLSTAFLLPAIVVGALFWAGEGRLSSRALTWLGAAAGLALLAWSVNLYLPIRSARDPILDWGDPQTWARFWRHYLAAQYRVWVFQSTADLGLNSREYLLSLPARLGWPVLALAVAGVWGIRRRLRIAILLGLVWVVTFVWASGYSIHDLAPYYLPADLVLVLLSGVGLTMLGALLAARLRGGNARAGTPVVAVALVALTASVAVSRWDEVDRSEDHFIRAHAARVLDSLPPNAILLSAFWDAVVSPSIYLQEIEQHRRDVTVVDPELVRRSWYFPQLRRRDARLLDPIETTLAAFLEDLALFEAGRPYDPARIEQNYRAVLRGIALGAPDRPVLFTPDVTPTFTSPAETVPEALVFAVSRGEREVSVPDLDSLLASGFQESDPIHLLALMQWRSMAENRARYLEHFGRSPEAEPWRALVREIDARAPGAARAGPRR